MAYRIAILADSHIDAEYVQSILKAWAQDRQDSVQAQRFTSAENFLFHYAEDKDQDILLLNIEMGAMDSVSLLQLHRMRGCWNCKINNGYVVLKGLHSRYLLIITPESHNIIYQKYQFGFIIFAIAQRFFKYAGIIILCN